MTVSQVCYSWRTAALATHSLWGTIHLNYSNLVAPFLQRSGQILLDVVVTKAAYIRSIPLRQDATPDSPIVQSMRLLSEHSHRIKSLSLNLSNRTLANALQELHRDSFTAPSLRKIILYNHDENNLPDIFYPRHFPALAHLELRRFCFVRHPTSLQFTTLETLIIQNVNDKPHNHPSQCVLRELLHVLYSNPRIRVFKLLDANCGERTPQPVEEVSKLPQVTLTHLREVEIKSNAACIDLFLTQCIISPSATVEFTTSDCSAGTPLPSTHTYDTQILPTLQSIVSFIAKRSDEMDGLEVTFHDLHYFANQDLPPRRSETCTVAFVTCYSDRSLASGPDFVRRDRFRFRCPVRVGWARILSELVFPLPLSGVRYFKLASLRLFPAVPLGSEIFGSWIAELISRCSPRGLHTLHLSGPALYLTPYFLKSMEPLHDAYTNTHAPLIHRKPTPLFYSLHTLVISNVSEAVITQRHDTKFLDFGEVLDAFRVQATRCRGSCGRFSTLILDRCTIEAEVLYELVDSIADIVGQRGRFTDNPPTVDPIAEPPPTPPLEPSASVAEFEPLPDADLDSTWLPEDLPNANQPEPEVTYWDAHVHCCQVTLDFRGCSGIKIQDVSNFHRWDTW